MRITYLVRPSVDVVPVSSLALAFTISSDVLDHEVWAEFLGILYKSHSVMLGP